MREVAGLEDMRHTSCPSRWDGWWLFHALVLMWRLHQKSAQLLWPGYVVLRLYFWEWDDSVFALLGACLFSARSSLVLLNLAWQNECHSPGPFSLMFQQSGWYPFALIEAPQVDWHGHGQLIEPHEVCSHGQHQRQTVLTELGNAVFLGILSDTKCTLASAFIGVSSVWVWQIDMSWTWLHLVETTTTRTRTISHYH